jgi:RNA polymerase sigma factor FliA
MATNMAVFKRALSRGTLSPRRRGLAGEFRAAPPAESHSETRARHAGQSPEEERQQRLVTMLPLVKRLALRMREHLPAHIELDELVGDGTLGLVDAVSKFDSAKRVKFESYARHRIRGGMLDGLRGLDPASRDLRRKSKKVAKTYRDLESKLGRRASDEEMAEALDMSLSKWHRTLRDLHSVSSDGGPQREVAMSGPAPVLDESNIPCSQPDPFELCYRQEQRDMLRHALGCLSERERRVMSLYYQQGMTMKEIANCLGVDESRISQIHSAALGRLKAHVQVLLHPSRPVASAVPVLVAA